MSYTGMSGTAIAENMRTAMELAVQKTAKRIEVTAKKYAPVRKVFAEKGSAKMVERKFIDTGLPANLRKKGSRASKPVERTVMVRSHRANRMSTSGVSRQDFTEVSAKEATTTRLTAAGERITELKPGFISTVGKFVKDERTIPNYYKLSDEAFNKLSVRGRYELGAAGRLHQASIDAGYNVSPSLTTVTEPYVPGKKGGYPRGAKLNSDGTVTFKRRAGRQTVIRVRNDTNIRRIVTAAAKNSKRTPIPVFTGTELKPSASGVMRVAGTNRKASAHQIKVWETHQEKVKEAKKKNRAVDDTFGGLNSRSFAATMTPFSDSYGSFKGPKFKTHFNLQLGGHLRDSINSAELNSKLKYRISAGVYYAVYQEFGTSHHPAHPFLRPALHENQGALLANAADKGRRAVQNMRKG